MQRLVKSSHDEAHFSQSTCKYTYICHTIPKMLAEAFQGCLKKYFSLSFCVGGLLKISVDKAQQIPDNSLEETGI